MIKSWGLRNFKSIHGMDIKLAKLTVLTGTNSSGKSSFIKSMLLIAQTLQDNVPSRPLILNGPLTQLGRFDNLKSYGSDEKMVTIKFEVDVKPTLSLDDIRRIRENKIRIITKETWELIFDAPVDKNGGRQESFSYQIAPRVSCLKINYSWIEHNDRESQQVKRGLQRVEDELVLEAYPPGWGIADVSLKGVMKCTDAGKLRKLSKSHFSEVVGIGLRHFIPVESVSVEDAFHTEPLDETHIGDYTDEEREWGGRIVYDPSYLYPRDMEMEFGKQLSNLFISSFKYLGPLRESPKIFYPLPKTGDTKDVGVAGEYTATVLDFHKNDMIKYVSSEKIDNIKKVLWLENEIFDIDIKMMQLVEQREILKSKPNEGDENTKRKIESDLESLEKKVNKKNEEIRKRWDEKNMMSALRDWLRYFGVAYDIKTSNHGEAGYKLQVKIVKKDKFLDLSSVGTGVSQVLPVLVMCLLADKGSTLVFEQPELHLHPRVQSRLADFFIAMAYSGKQCIVETHSEYFIDKLRLRVCESSLKNKKCPNLFKDLTKVYFFDKEEDVTEVRELEINKYGEMSEWPKDFLDTDRRENTRRLLDTVADAIFESENDQTGNSDD